MSRSSALYLAKLWYVVVSNQDGPTYIVRDIAKDPRQMSLWYLTLRTNGHSTPWPGAYTSFEKCTNPDSIALHALRSEQSASEAFQN